MFKNYLKIALRSILQHKAYSLINILGLAIGMASGILILLWVYNELSYDSWHKHAGQVYRITVADSDIRVAVSPGGMTQGFQSVMPEIKNTVRLSAPSSALFSVGERKFEENRIFYADSTFLQVFSFPLLKGNALTALQRPDGILLTENMAEKYFGKQDPMGKVLRRNNNRDVVVTGMLANIPPNSHLQFDFILPLSAPEQRRDITANLWTNFIFYDYVQLDDHFKASHTAIAALEQKMNKIFKQNNNEIKIGIYLQPLTRIHLYSKLDSDLEGHGNIQYVNIFFIVAIFIMVVACINFMNLATARSARRAKEVGLRKVVGAFRGQLIAQFLGESMLISLLSLVISIVIVWLALPSFNKLAGKALTISLWDGRMLIALLGISIATGLISGSYPALFLSGFQPVKVLKGNLRGLGGNRMFRNALVVVQFVVSIVLLIGTVVSYNQIRYIKNRDLGYEKENLLYTAIKGNLGNNKRALYDALAKDPSTSQFAVTSELPTNLTTGTIDMVWPGKDPNSQILFPSMDVSESFFDVFHMKLLSGRVFSKDLKTDTGSYIVNETAVRTMGMTPASAVGQRVTYRDNKGTIIGVVADFNFKPIQRAIQPLVMQLNRGGGIVVVRTRPGETEATIRSLAKITQALDPSYPFIYNFLDQDLANQYRGEQQMGNIFNLFALLSLFISFLGLYGLSAYMAEQRTREIGVRKILGASLFNIVRLLSTNFTLLVLIATMIAVPLAWWGVNRWLENFAYHIHPGWIVFTFAPAAALLIAWLTVSYETIKAGIANPVKSLRSE